MQLLEKKLKIWRNKQKRSVMLVYGTGQRITYLLLFFLQFFYYKRVNSLEVIQSNRSTCMVLPLVFTYFIFIDLSLTTTNDLVQLIVLIMAVFFFFSIIVETANTCISSASCPKYAFCEFGQCICQEGYFIVEENKIKKCHKGSYDLLIAFTL